MLHSTPHLWAISLLCSIGAADTGSPLYTNTTSLIPRGSTVGSNFSSSVAVSSIQSFSISSTIPISSGTDLSSIVSASILSTSSRSFSSNSSLKSSPSQVISKNDTTTVSSSLSKSLSLGSSTGSNLSTGSQPATKSASVTTYRSLSSILSSSSSQSSISTGPITTTVTESGSTQILTLPPSSITSPPTLVINWSTVTPITTSGVSSPTHDSHGWPIIPALHCWFCPPTGSGGGIGFVIPGVIGPGILVPPPAGVEPPPGFSSNMPSITLDSAGDPTYESTEPTSQPTNSASSTQTKSSSSSCTSTTTGYNLYVTCTSVTSTALLAPSGSVSCETSTVTTTGCDVTTTASTTVDACPLSALASMSVDYLSERAAAGTVVSGTTYPLALWPTEVSISISSSLTASTSGSSSGSLASGTSSVRSTLATSTSVRSSSSSAPPPTSTSPSTSTTLPTNTITSTAPTGPTGFHLVALKCSASDCEDALEIAPSAQDSCGTIAQNQEAWWGAAFPHPAEEKTEYNGDQIAPFSVLQDSSDFDLLYVFGDNFSSDLCGLPKLNFTFTKTGSTQWTWLDTDNNSGTCYDNTGSEASTCSHNDLTYTAQELLVCVQPNNPTYCASVSV